MLTESEIREVLPEVIRKIRDKHSLLSSDETAIRYKVILRILHVLQWRTFNPTEVIAEFQNGPDGDCCRFTDYRLLDLSTNESKILIEVRHRVEKLDKRYQKLLLDHAVGKSVGIVILTNGCVWQFFLPREQQSCTIDFDSPEFDVINVNRLVNYLFKEKVFSGDAERNIRDSIQTLGEYPEKVTFPQATTNHSSVEQGLHRKEVGEKNTSETEAAEPAKQIDEGAPFAQRFYQARFETPSAATDSHIWLPEGGPQTEESARAHTEQSIQFGRQGTTTPKIVMRWEPKRAAKALENEFKRMVHGDYGERCQICSRTFKNRSGEPQTFAIHIVRPSCDSRTNHFGNLIGLCAWHSELVQHGQWTWIDHETGQPVQGWERLQVLLFNAPQRTDESGNVYLGLLVRFWNVYQDRDPEPKTVDEEIRYSIPHWKYLCELLRAKEE